MGDLIFKVNLHPPKKGGRELKIKALILSIAAVILLSGLPLRSYSQDYL
jgi:hypothetical protein